MNSSQKVAALAFKKPWLTLVVGLLLTIFFAFGCAQVEIKTIFSDLLPKNHPYVKTYKEHSNFGNPLTVTIMVKRIDGETIFNQKTLEKIWNISRDIDLTPGVDHDQIVSIATEKARFTVVTADGIFTNPIMDDHPPKNINEINEIKRRINESPTVSSFLVSNDHNSAIINATFIESLVDYKVVYDAVQALKVKFSDDQHEIHASGWPVLTGWVYFFGKDTPMIFMITFSLMFIFLLLSMRNIAGVVTPLIVSIVSAIWGFGFVGWIHQPIEPLLMVVPMLLIARSFSHRKILRIIDYIKR
jgi:predicted RND superfamily exporter protein